MRRLRFTLVAAFLLFLAACGGETSIGRTTLPAARITSVTPLELVPGAELTVSGANFFAVAGASGMKIEVCGVVLNGSVIEPLTQNLLLPPGSFIMAQVGHAVAATMPEHGFTEGPSRVLVTRPDGNSAVLADAVTCMTEIRQPEPVVAVLAASATTGVAPAVISFDASASTGEGDLQFAWDFGVAGATATGAEVSYEYQTTGEYTVTLTVTDSTGATASATQAVRVNPVLQAVIQYGEVTGYAPVTVDFNATGSTGIAPLTYTWDFGDGTPVSSSPEPQHEFARGGTIKVTLTVTDANGVSDAAEVELVIADPVAVNAVLDADVLQGAAPLTVNFSGLRSSGEGPLDFVWGFGDGTSNSVDPEPTFTFLAGGTYHVSLSVTDETGRIHSASQAIEVDPEPASLSFLAEPAGLNPVGMVTVTGEGVSETVQLLEGVIRLPPGDYTVTPAPFELAEEFAGQAVTGMWTAQSRLITLSEGEVQTLALEFEPVSGQLEVTLSGLPAGDHPGVYTVVPLHATLGLTADTSDLSQLLPGFYELTFSSVRVQEDGWFAVYEPVQSVVQLTVGSGQATRIEVRYELQPSGGLNVQFTYPDAQVPFTLSGMNGTFDQTEDAIPPGEYALTLQPVDYVNEAGQNGVRPTFERWTPLNSEYTVRLSSNEVSDITPLYSMGSPVIRLTVTEPSGAVNFRSDVAISGPNHLISIDGTVSGYELDTVFGENCVRASSTNYFEVDSRTYPSESACFTIDTAGDYGGRNNAYPVRVDYRPRRVTFPDHPDGTAPAGTLQFAYNLDEWFITERMEVWLEVEGLPTSHLTWFAPGRFKSQGTGTFEATAGTRVRIRVTLYRQSIPMGTHYSPYLDITP